MLLGGNDTLKKIKSFSNMLSYPWWTSTTKMRLCWTSTDEAQVTASNTCLTNLEMSYACTVCSKPQITNG